MWEFMGQGFGFAVIWPLGSACQATQRVFERIILCEMRPWSLKDLEISINEETQ